MKLSNYVCSRCGKSYVSQAWFNKHMLSCSFSTTKAPISKAPVKPPKPKCFMCPRCDKGYSGLKCFNTHIKKCHSVPSEPRISELAQAFNFEEDYFIEQHASADPSVDHLDQLTVFAAKSNNFKLLHLNINSLFNKASNITAIADTGLYDFTV